MVPEQRKILDIQQLMDAPSAIPKDISGLPSDVADVVRRFDTRSVRQNLRRQFEVQGNIGENSVILAHFDALRDIGSSNAADTAIGTFYREIIKPSQQDWTLEELKAIQNGPERQAQKKQSDREASLRRLDALIERLGD